MKFPYYDNQTNDDYKEENSQNNQDRSHQRAYSIKHFYKRGDSY